MRLFLALLIIPLIEITLFVQIGGAIGLFWTIAIVILTALLGASLLRSQGIQTVNRLQKSLQNPQDITTTLADAVVIAICGIFLMTPGFFTDALGLLFLIPSVRHGTFQLLKNRITATSYYGNASSPRDDIIDAEYTDLDPNEPRSNRTPLKRRD